MINTYLQLQPRADNINQVISAEDVNALQRLSMDIQKSLFDIKSHEFLQNALFSLNHHPVVNAMWIDLFEDNTNIDQGLSPGITHNSAEQSITFNPNNTTTTAVYFSKTFDPTPPWPELIKHAILLVDEHIPNGTSISYAISNDGTDYYPITPNLGTTIVIPTDNSRLKIRATLTRDINNPETPRLYGVAVLFA